jgi:gonadotropin-releasing hormone receptor
MIVMLLNDGSEDSLRQAAHLSASPIRLLEYFSHETNSSMSESEMADDPSIDVRQKLVMTIFILTMILAVGGPKNFQVVRCLLCNKNKLYTKSRHHLLLLNLAIADSIVLFLMIPCEIGWRMTSDWRAGNYGCKIFQFIRVFGLYASSMVLICISIDRYYAVVKPFRYGSMSSRISKLLKISWLLSFLISTPQVRFVRFHHINLT